MLAKKLTPHVIVALYPHMSLIPGKPPGLPLEIAKIHDRVSQLCMAHSLVCLDLSKWLMRFDDSRAIKATPFDGHPSAEAHRAIAEALHETLREQKAEAGQDRLQFQPWELGAKFRSDLQELVRAAKKTGKVVAMATFSHQVHLEQTPEQQLKASNTSLYYMPFMTPLGLIAAFERYNDIIRDVARENDVILIEGENDIPGDREHFSDSVHFTDAGSRAMAQRVSEALLQASSFRRLVRSSDFFRQQIE